MIRELLLKDFSWWGVAWQSTLFAVIGLVGSFLLRRRPSRSCQVLFLAMIAAVLVPALSVLVRHFEMGLLAAERATVKPDTASEVAVSLYEMPVVLPRMDIPDEVPAGIAEPAGTKAASGNLNIPWRMIAIYGWMAAALILMGRLLVAFVGGIGLLRRAQVCGCEQIRRAADSARARLGMIKGLEIRSSKGLRSPVMWCWSRPPVLLVPAELDRGVDWVGVISHEIAHRKRWDHVSGLMAELVVCVLPWNPLLWWCKKQMVRLSEQACDDWVVAGGRPGTEYAQSLLNLSPEVQMAFLPTVIGKEKPMKERIYRIVKERCGEPRVGAGWALAVTAIAASLAVGAAFAQRRPAEAGSPERDEQTVQVEIDRPRDVSPERRDELAGQARQIRVQIAQTEKELAGLEDQQLGQSEEARALRARIQELSEQMQAARQELERLERGAGDAEVRRRPQIEGQADELARHLRELEGAAQLKESTLRYFEEQDRGNTDEAYAIRRQLGEIRQRIQAAQEELAGLERRRPVNREIPVESGLGPHPEALVQAREELRERARQIEVELREHRDMPPVKAEKLQAELRAIQGKIEQVERELGSPQTQAAVDRPPQPVLRFDSDRVRELTQRRRELEEEVRRIERRLEELGGEHPEEAGELQVQLDRTYEQMRMIERELDRFGRPALRVEVAAQPGAEARRERLMAERERDNVSYDRPQVRERDGLEREVSELRGQVDKLSEEMRELRDLMKRLLEQRGPREPM